MVLGVRERERGREGEGEREYNSFSLSMRRSIKNVKGVQLNTDELTKNSKNKRKTEDEKKSKL